MKAGLKESAKAKDGYDAANGDSQKIESKEYEGKSSRSQEKITFTIEASSSPGSVTNITIEQRNKN
jgi:hypothetical protein